jgi:hypothetical protein
VSSLEKKKPAAFLALKPRRCKYCRAIFVPARPQDAQAKFCEPNHRKAYHRYGGLPFDKLMDRVRKEIKREFADLEKRIDAKIRAHADTGAISASGS